jgi:uncharacterized protein YggE
MRLSALLIPLALTTALAFPVAASAQEFRGGTISVDGQGMVTATPDTAYITSGVTSQGPTAREALDANTAAMTELIETLKAAGIEARDIQTSGFSVSPNYVYTEERDANGYTLPPKINGYNVYNTVTVRVRDITKLGTVLDQSVSVGANTVNGVSFTVADPSTLYDEARKKAFADARHKAELYADTARLELEQIRSITESQGYNQPQPYMMRDAAVEVASAAVPVEAGELTFTINVQVTWEID